MATFHRHLFDFWADLFVYLLLLKSSMGHLMERQMSKTCSRSNKVDFLAYKCHVTSGKSTSYLYSFFSTCPYVYPKQIQLQSYRGKGELYFKGHHGHNKYLRQNLCLSNTGGGHSSIGHLNGYFRFLDKKIYGYQHNTVLTKDRSL